MAKVTAPLFSFSARGKLAKSLVFMSWKGIADVRQHVIPANPKTDAQVAQRNILTLMVGFWKTEIIDPSMRKAWNLAAQLGSTVQSGFNAFISSSVTTDATIPTASYASTCAPATGLKAAFTMLNLADGTTGTEVGNFNCWAGNTNSNLQNIGTAAISSGVITTPAISGAAGDKVFVKISKPDAATPPTEQDRSGICAITLTA